MKLKRQVEMKVVKLSGPVAAKSAAWALAIIIIAASFIRTECNPVTLVQGIPGMINLIKDMFPPDFSKWREYLRLTMETVAMGLWGTVIALIITFPLSFLGAVNTSPNKALQVIVKGIFTFLRAVPELVYALLFVFSLGFGVLPGILTLSLSASGLLGKFFVETIETIDPKPMEAIQATGGHHAAVLRHAVFPQVLPLFIGYILYTFDHNVRTAMAIGIIGAGGLGLELFRTMETFKYPQVLAILIIMFLIVTAVDRLSLYVRNKIISGDLLEKGRRIIFRIVLILIIISCTALLVYIPLDLNQAVKGLPFLFSFISKTFPPDFSEMPKYMNLIIDTLAIGISGTVIAVIISIPLGILASKNFVRFPVVFNIAREIINFFRAIGDVVFALIFVVAVGLGPFAGVLALGVHSAGLLAKFYSEAVENIDTKPKEALEATGAKTIQVIRHSVFPQIMPLFNSYNLYILDRNIRTSTVLGLVGAGGIGFELTMGIRLFQYNKILALLIIILTTIFIVDKISEYIRKKIV
jgi:phosphonate transport system permease protein